jgi:hypothetical protein
VDAVSLILLDDVENAPTTTMNDDDDVVVDNDHATITTPQNQQPRRTNDICPILIDVCIPEEGLLRCILFPFLPAFVLQSAE